MNQNAGFADEALLERLSASNDPSAFAEGVRRYGGMVRGICTRILRNPHDAEDAFQATFLMLFRKAGSIRKTESLASWLYRVSVHTALNAKTSAMRRNARERQAMAMKSRGEDPAETWDRIRPVLDEELSRLPEKYRAALVLRYLEGDTEEGVARKLGCPRTTVSTRLGRALELLRERLLRRGAAVTSALLGALIVEKAASASVGLPVTLVASTVKAGTLMAAGEATEGIISAQAMTLVKGGLKAMMWTKIKIAAAVMAASVAGTGGSVAAYKALAPEQETKAETAKVSAVPKDLPPAIPVEKFKSLHELIKPHPGELRWREIPWLTSIPEAREKAAAQDKPILIWLAADGNPLGRC